MYWRLGETEVPKYLQEAFKSGKSCSRPYWLKLHILKEQEMRSFEKNAKKWWMLTGFERKHYTAPTWLYGPLSMARLSEMCGYSRRYPKGPEIFRFMHDWICDSNLNAVVFCQRVEQSMFELCREGALFDARESCFTTNGHKVYFSKSQG